MPKRKLRNLKLRAIAVVDNPCQEHALALTIKRFEDVEGREKTAEFLAKYVSESDGAHSFMEVLRANMFSEKIWPCVDAFSQSIRSIVGDASLTGAARAEKIAQSTGEFLAAVRDIAPDVSKRLETLVRKEEGPMPKTVEELQAEVEKLTGQLTSANALATSEKARADTAEAALTSTKSELEAAKAAGGELATVKAELATTKAQLIAATDATITVGGQQIKKSAVGDAQFSVMKALADERDQQKLEKRAETEFGHVVGTTAEKALVLKGIEGLPEDNETRKATLAILTSAEKMAKNGFDTLGRQQGELTETGKAAVAKFEGKVSELVQKGVSRSDAMSQARRENPELFAEYQDAQG